jgi:Mrp family chromosome partitioning ATPase/capsular polysaccharide biosynthesis protein
MNDEQSQQELDLRHYLRPILRRRWLILTITAVAAAATYLISSHQQKTYDSSTRVYITDADPTLDITAPGSFGAPTTQSVANVAQLITAQSVTDAVSRTLGMPASSAGSVTAAPSSNSDFVTVTATARRPALAARLANTYVSAFLSSRAQAVSAQAQRDEQAAKITLATLPKSSNGASGFSERQTLLQEITTYRQVILNPSVGARQINTAAVPGLPTSPQPKRDAIFGGVVGLVLGILAAFCIDLMDRRLVSVATVESVFGRPVLAVLPHVADPTPMAEGHRAVVPRDFVEELRSLTVMLRLGGDAGGPRTIMVTSTLPREGKSTVTRDLALVYAETGHRVLVIDGDLRRPSMDQLFGIEAEQGLVQILRGERSLSEVAVVAITANHGAEPSTNGHGAASAEANGGGGKNGKRLPGSVDVVVHGEALKNPLALMSAERMTALFQEASQVYDIVLLDTSPVLTVADSVPLMEVVDTVLLVARMGQTTRQSADRFGALMRRLSGVVFAGVIANDRRDQQLDDEGYGSYSVYGRYYRKDTKKHRFTRERNGTEPSEEKAAGTTAA